MASKAGRPFDKGKRDHIVNIASELFMELGFEATTMEKIAKLAAISKLTLYNRFADKDALFAEVIARKCAEFVPVEKFDVAENKTTEKILYELGLALLSLITSEDAVRMHRMLVAESGKNPHLIELFYISGPAPIKQLFIEKMDYLKKHRKLRITSVEEAKEFFCALFNGSDIYQRCILNIGPRPTQKELETHTGKAVQFFMQAYG